MSEDNTIFLLDISKKRVQTFNNKNKPQNCSELFYILMNNSEAQVKQKYIYSLDGDLLGEFSYDSNTFKNYSMNDYYYIEYNLEKNLIDIFNTKGEKQTTLKV